MRLRPALVLVPVALSALLVPSSSVAASDSSSSLVTATVAASASVTTTNLAFGNYTGTQLDGTSSIGVTATTGTSYTIGINNGANGTSVSDRKLRSSSGGLLGFQLYSDSGRSQPWGSSSSNAVTGTGNGASQNFTVYGRIPGNQSSPIGNYQDTLTVTVTY